MPAGCICTPAGARPQRSKRATILGKMDANTKINVQTGFAWMVDAVDQVVFELKIEKVAKVRVWPRVGEGVVVGQAPHGVWKAVQIHFRGGRTEYDYTNYGSREDGLFFGAPVNEDKRLDDLEKAAMQAEQERLQNATVTASARKKRARPAP